jgi:uncharacterized membrane protein
MNCAYHAQNTAVVNCSGCGKSLCPACDHRIKGFPFCQDCIVSGVQLLQNRFQSNNVPFVKKQTSPFIATVLSMICPGLGAAYNGQSSKALIYFGVFVGLFQMAVLTQGMPMFVFGFIAMWLYSALDAWRTAKAIRSGVSVDNADDILVQRFTSSPKMWGILLAILGGISFIYTMGFQLPMKSLVSVALIGFGVYLLKDFIAGKKVNENDFANREIPGSVVTGNLYETNFKTGDFSSFDEYKTNNEAKTWKTK